MKLSPSLNWLFAFVPITIGLEHVGGIPVYIVIALMFYLLPDTVVSPR